MLVWDMAMLRLMQLLLWALTFGAWERANAACGVAPDRLAREL